MTMDSAMLKVKSTSSANGGSGSTTIASTASTPMGTPTPTRSRLRIEGLFTGGGVCHGLVPGFLDLRIDDGTSRAHRAGGRGAQLDDVGEHLCDRDVQRRGHLCIQGSTSRNSTRASGGASKIGTLFSVAILRMLAATSSTPLATTIGARMRLSSYRSATE